MHRMTARPGDRLGLIGGGQLGRMFTQAAMSMGFRVVVLDPDADCPAAQVGAQPIVGRWDAPAAIDDLARLCGHVTVEFENVPARALFRLQRRGVLTRPGWKGLWVSQNRIREKRFLSSLGIPLPRWGVVRTEADLPKVAAEVGFPLILKTASEGYDGKGQTKVHEAHALSEAWASLGRKACVAESVVPFHAELSIIVARDVHGNVAFFGPMWNHHTNHILDWTIHPAPFGPVTTAEARAIARQVVEALDHVGLMTVELFLTGDGDLVVNELAPRPHNSGHWTIEGSTTSQFEQQARILAGMCVGDTSAEKPACMANLLGDVWNGGEPDWAAALAGDRGVKLHLYGKAAAKTGRKMGHLTVVDDDPRQALARVESVRNSLSSRGHSACSGELIQP